MSHVNTYKAKIKDPALFAEILKKLGASDITMGKHVFTQYRRNKVDCILSALLPNWRYKIGIKENGDIAYDNFGSKQGSMEIMGHAIQSYYHVKITEEIDYTLVSNVETNKLENGDLELVLTYN